LPNHPDLFWGLVASMWVGNCFLVILNVPLVRYWLSVFKIPFSVLFPGILFFCCIGTYSINNNLDDLYIMSMPPADLDLRDEVFMANPLVLIAAACDPLTKTSTSLCKHWQSGDSSCARRAQARAWRWTSTFAKCGSSPTSGSSWVAMRP